MINLDELGSAVYNARCRLMSDNQISPIEATKCVKVYMTHEGYAELMHSINVQCSSAEYEISNRGTILGCDIYRASPLFNSNSAHPLWSVVTVCPI